MKKFSVPLLVCLCSLVCACSRKPSPEVKPPSVDLVQQTPGEGEEVKAATPEDPGPLATVVGPLSVWKRDAKAAAAEREVSVQHVPQQLDRVLLSNRLKKDEQPQNLLHTAFSVRDYTQFAFVIPSHQGNARLHGNFRSFTKAKAHSSTSDKPADIDLLLLNDQEFNDFLTGRLSEATLELNAAHDHELDWRLPATFEQSQEYHLVFSNSAGAKIKFVEANFTVSFE